MFLQYRQMNKVGIGDPQFRALVFVCTTPYLISWAGDLHTQECSTKWSRRGEHIRMRSYVRTHRYGYHPADAEKIVAYLSENRSPYALPAEIALRCGLRENEIAGLKGGHVDRERRLLCFKGKGGRYREVPISVALLGRLGETAGLVLFFHPKAFVAS